MGFTARAKRADVLISGRMTPADPLLVYFAVLLLVGAVVGVMAGLFGVGGGFLMVPAQFWALGLLGVDPETALRTAFGTSLAVVIPTAASGAWAHHCRRCVRWDAVRWMGLSAALAALAGALLSTRVPGRPLELLLGLVLCAAAIQLLMQRGSCDVGDEERVLTPGGYLALGVPGGLLSGLLGIGGGIVLVPLLTLVLRYPVRTAVGTSTPVILCAALGGVVGYALTVPAALETLPGRSATSTFPAPWHSRSPRCRWRRSAPGSRTPARRGSSARPSPR